MGFFIGLGLLLTVYLTWLQKKWTHQPYMALRADAGRMIREGSLPKRETLKATIAAASAGTVTWSLSTIDNQKRQPNVPHRPSVFALSGAITTEYAGNRTKRQIKRGYTLQQLAEHASIQELIIYLNDNVEEVIARFHDENAARALRRRAEDIAYQGRRFDRQMERFQEAQAAWRDEGEIKQYHEDGDLIGFLAEAPVQDTDLWHEVATAARLGDARDEAGLFWIMSQQACDQATVAAFLSRIFYWGDVSWRVREEHTQGQTYVLDEVGAVIERWHAGFYTNATLAFDSAEAAIDPFPQVIEAFDEVTARISKSIGYQPWIMPENLFRPFPGHAGHPKHSFGDEGLMTLPPKIEDFVSPEFFKIPSVHPAD